MSRFEGGYGLIIGVSEYSDPAWNVPIAERDAQELYNALTDPEIGAYDRGRVRLLLGAEATVARVAEELRFLAVHAAAADTAFIAFTGHGALDERNLYCLATSDTAFTANRQIARGSGYGMGQLASALREIRAERLLLAINACSSGHLNALATNDGPKPAAIPEGDRKEVLKSGRGRALITASRPDELSHFTRDGHNSYFGRALVDGLRGVNVSPASGYVGLFDLYTALYDQVTRDAAAAGHAQHPQLNLAAGEGPFPVARYPRSAHGDPGRIQQELPVSADIQRVSIQITDNRVTDNRKLIDFGSAQIGSVTFRGDVAQGDITKTYYGSQPAEDEGDERLDPLGELQKIRARIEQARNVDEDARDDAAGKVKQAHRALDQGDQARARQRIAEALEILDALNNGYVNSIARKLRAVRDAL